LFYISKCFMFEDNSSYLSLPKFLNSESGVVVDVIAIYLVVCTG
jgi:hypothetical protein